MTEAEWLEGNDVRGMLKHLGDCVTDRKSFLFAVYCCRRVGEGFSDHRTRRVVECAELVADGLATREDFRRSYEAAVEAWREAMDAADEAERQAARAGVSSKYGSPAYVQARRNAWAADVGQHFFFRGVQLADKVSGSVRGVGGMSRIWRISPSHRRRTLSGCGRGNF
jgi:hypothetical protein